MSLSPYICTQCGGSVDRKTLTCAHCGTEFYIDDQHILVVKEGRPGEHTIHACTEIDPYDLTHNRERRLEHAVEDLTFQLARELAPYLDIEQGADPRRGVFLLYAHCKVLEPPGHYTAVQTRSTLSPKRQIYRDDDIIHRMIKGEK